MGGRLGGAMRGREEVLDRRSGVGGAGWEVERIVCGAGAGTRGAGQWGVEVR